MRTFAPPKASGFVLIGVVMMVLALTILGLSLFSLSSYEAQFMNHSLDETKVLQIGMGGIERARFALSVSPHRLDQVQSNLPMHVIETKAYQQKPGFLDSLGVYIGGGNDIQIKVTARYNTVTKTVTGSYRPALEDNYYKRLMTIGIGGFRVNDKVGPLALPACGTVILGNVLSPDSIWEHPAAPLQLTCGLALLPPIGVNRRFVPSPSISAFLATPRAPLARVAPNGNYPLNGTPDQVSYYYTNDTTSQGQDFDFSSRNAGAATVTVNGHAVWILPRGLRADGLVTIQGGTDPNATLTIVAHNGVHHSAGNDPGAVWFFGGVVSNIPLILVTDGDVKIEQFNQINGLTVVNNLSIFANRVFLTGPEDPLVPGTFNIVPNFMRLAYGPSVMDPLIDDLMERDALPNSITNTPLPLVAGSWRVIP